jgi:hypothetical protein
MAHKAYPCTYTIQKGEGKKVFYIRLYSLRATRHPDHLSTQRLDNTKEAKWQLETADSPT